MAILIAFVSTFRVEFLFLSCLMYLEIEGVYDYVFTLLALMVDVSESRHSCGQISVSEDAEAGVDVVLVHVLRILARPRKIIFDWQLFPKIL